jgi:hypothetical protein
MRWWVSWALRACRSTLAGDTLLQWHSHAIVMAWDGFG